MSKSLINNLTKLDSLMKTAGNLEPRLASLCDSMSSLKLEEGSGLSPRQRMTAEWTARSLTSLGSVPSILVLTSSPSQSSSLD